MSRTIPAALVSVLSSEQNIPVELYEVYLEGITYYYANAEQNITFGSQTYTALGISRTRVSTSIDSKVDEISVQLDNVDKSFSQLIQSKSLPGKRIVIKKVFRGYLGSADNYIVTFDGKADSIAIDQDRVLVRIVSSLDAITKRYPGRTFKQTCNYKLGDTWCTVNRESAANKGTGTATSGTVTTLVDTVNLNQADDYWNNGFVKVTGGTNSGLSRPILDFVQSSKTVTFRIGFPVAIDNTSQYTIYRGCDKTQSDCVNKFSNWANYGGFVNIPEQPFI